MFPLAARRLLPANRVTGLGFSTRDAVDALTFFLALVIVEDGLRLRNSRARRTAIFILLK
jgi:hypothetical protein